MNTHSAAPAADKHSADVLTAPIREVVTLEQFKAKFREALLQGAGRKEPLVAILTAAAQGEPFKYVDAVDRTGRRFIVGLPGSAAAYHAGIVHWLELQISRFIDKEKTSGGYVEIKDGKARCFGTSRGFGSATHSEVERIIEASFTSGPSPGILCSLPPQAAERAHLYERVAARFPLAVLRLEKVCGFTRRGGYYGHEPNPFTVLSEKAELDRLSRTAKRGDFVEAAGEKLFGVLEEMYFGARRMAEGLEAKIQAAEDADGRLKGAVLGIASPFHRSRCEKFEARAMVLYSLISAAKRDPAAKLSDLLEPALIRNRRDVEDQAESVAFRLAR